MIAGLDFPTSGRVLLDGEDVTYNRGRDRDIAFVFQMFALYPHMNCFKNLAFPLVTQGTPQARGQGAGGRDRQAPAHRAPARPPRRRPGGRRPPAHRLGAGRSSAGPKAFLMDEPLGALDTEFRDLMCQELRGLHDRIDATTVYVTHDQVEAMSMGDMIAVMNKGDLLQVGPPQEIYDNPATLFVADFIGNPPMNFLAVEGGLPAGADTVRLAGGAVTGIHRLAEDVGHDDLAYGIRPEHVVIGDDGPMRGRVFGVEYMGARQVVTVDTDAGRLKARTGGGTRAVIGETIGLDFRADRAIVFDRRTGRALARETSSPAPREAAHG